MDTSLSTKYSVVTVDSYIYRYTYNSLYGFILYYLTLLKNPCIELHILIKAFNIQCRR